MNTKQKGAIAESAITTDLISRGYTVSIPVGNYGDYDLIVDRNGTLERVQVKYTNLTDEGKIVVRSRCHSTGAHKVITTKVYTDKDIEWIAVYEATQRNCYYVPVIGTAELWLRVTEPKKADSKIRWAKDYTEI